jgi:hypothetical protein
MADPATLAACQQALAATRQARDLLRQEAQAARAALETLARQLAPAAAADLDRRAPDGLPGVPTADLLQATLAALATPAPDPASAELRRCRQQLDTYAYTIQELRIALNAAQNAAQAAQQQAARPRRRSHFAVPETVNAHLWPDWLQRWRGEDNFNHCAALLERLGRVGMPLRTQLIPALARALRGGRSRPSGTETRAFERCVAHGAVDVLKGHRGATVVDLVRLSERGATAFKLIFGQPPVDQALTRLLRHHGAPDHVLLILDTAALLQQAGYAVERFPAPVPVAGLGEYRPDLTATYEERTLYVEAECMDAAKNPRERHAKWLRAARVAPGRELFVSVDTEAEVKALWAELTRHLGTASQPVYANVMVVTQQMAKSPKSTGMGVWTHRRGFGRARERGREAGGVNHGYGGG